jgi:hypothetical protein
MKNEKDKSKWWQDIKYIFIIFIFPVVAYLSFRILSKESLLILFIIIIWGLLWLIDKYQSQIKNKK